MVKDFSRNTEEKDHYFGENEWVLDVKTFYSLDKREVTHRRYHQVILTLRKCAFYSSDLCWMIYLLLIKLEKLKRIFWEKEK